LAVESNGVIWKPSKENAGKKNSGGERTQAAIRGIEASGNPHARADQPVRKDRRPFTATGCSADSNSWAFQLLNIAGIIAPFGRAQLLPIL
jgi:hypothetical protein